MIYKGLLVLVYWNLVCLSGDAPLDDAAGRRANDDEHDASAEEDVDGL